MNTEINKCEGAMLGLAAGDALGTTVEFKSAGSFAPMTDIVGGGVFGLKAGQWTDDTSMALCLADSLIEKNEFDAFDQLQRYVKWYREGYNSSTGRCFDIGNATRQALFLFEDTGQPYCGSTDKYAAGNGSIMRLAPIAIRYFNQPELLLKYADSGSRTTHAATQCVEACMYMAVLLAEAIKGTSKRKLLDGASILEEYFTRTQITDTAILDVINGSYKTKQPPQIYGSGHVVRTLEAALWAFYHTNDFKSGALKVVNLGDDADTTGAVYGQIAGAYYGKEGIPEDWLKKLYRRMDLEIIAETLYKQASSG
jgi:ADP-ribosyl-[dinitrogen reductase] hydrolase